MNIPNRVNPLSFDSSLPKGYTRLGFLESTGTQYIKTDWSSQPGDTIDWYTEFQLTKLNKSQLEGYVGNNYSGWIYYGVSHNDPPLWYLGCKNAQLTANLADTLKHSARLLSSAELTGGWLDGTIFTSGTFNPNWNFNSGEFMLFRTNHRSTPFYQRKFYTCIKINERKHELLPALDPSGTPCMYDTVSGETFRNAGTGQFTVGLSTVEDVRTLHLPNTGGSLTLSVPSTTTEADLTVIHANNPNWTLTIQIRDYE